MSEKVFRITIKQMEEIKSGNINQIIQGLVSIGISHQGQKLTKVQGGYFNEDESEKIYILKFEPNNGR